ncbi:MAG: metallopeptidase family protein [Actinomycetes bacterium]
MPSRRDRRGRGLRGVLAPQSVPVTRSRAEAFDEIVLEAVLRVQQRLPDQLRAVEFAVEDVPPSEDGGGVPLGSSSPAAGDQPARVVVYRRPVETRAASERVRALVVNDVVVEQVADLLGIEPDAVDPDYGTE